MRSARSKREAAFVSSVPFLVFQIRDHFPEFFDGKLRADKKGDWIAQSRISANGEILHPAVVADLLEDLIFPGILT